MPEMVKKGRESMRFSPFLINSKQEISASLSPPSKTGSPKNLFGEPVFEDIAYRALGYCPEECVPIVKRRKSVTLKSKKELDKFNFKETDL